jgi:membrane protease YdiL (CAAX protease family)
MDRQASGPLGRPLTGLARLYARAIAPPDYPADAGDRHDASLAGLAIPVRAGAALLATTVLVLLDQLGTLMPIVVGVIGEPAGAFGRAIERAILFGLVPLAIVVIGFGDRPRRYGLRLGEWRWGAPLLAAGLVVMTPVILGLAALPEFRSYYGGASTPIGERLLANLVELVPAEFLLRGFLFFALFRRIGPLALLVVQLPFVFSHVGKPELELWSTFIGGTVFAWLDWRTGSILWSALGHVYVLTLLVAAVRGATVQL